MFVCFVPAQYDVYKESTIQVFSAKVLSAEEIAEQEAAAAAEEKEKSDADAKPASASAAAGARDGEEKEDGGAVLVNIKVDPAAPLSSPSGGATSVPASDDLPPLASRPFMVRQPTNEDLQYGDILVVKLIQARNLMAVDWNGTSDPYALVAVDKQSAKSSIIKKKLNPIWNETFFFHLGQSRIRHVTTRVRARLTPSHRTRVHVGRRPPPRGRLLLTRLFFVVASVCVS